MKMDRLRVKRLMFDQGYETYTQLADAMGISKEVLSRWMLGEAFTSKSLGLLCQTLKCTPNDILVWEEAKEEVAPKAMALMGAMA